MAPSNQQRTDDAIEAQPEPAARLNGPCHHAREPQMLYIPGAEGS
jgi:hypothetical protein